jgi:transcriptional regulator with XRE-family HTH domain
MSDFGTRVRKVRKERNMTIVRLAELCDSSENVIRNYEKSRRLPQVDMLVRICNALKVSPEYLLQDGLVYQSNHAGEELLQKISRLSPKNVSVLTDMVDTLGKYDDVNELIR